MENFYESNRGDYFSDVKKELPATAERSVLEIGAKRLRPSQALKTLTFFTVV
ncbi:MAG: hypothetical protein Q7U03_02300 [Syntrophales bacterium]|nr:hypothetical protein [Syntrophales bacterium]